MIPELIFYGALFLVCVGFLIALSEPENLEHAVERRHVNHLADQSNRRKPQGKRQRCRHAWAGWRLSK